MPFDLKAFVDKYGEEPGIIFTDGGREQTYDEVEEDGPGTVELFYLEEKEMNGDLVIPEEDYDSMTIEKRSALWLEQKQKRDSLKRRLDGRTARIEAALDEMSHLWEPGFVNPPTGNERADAVLKSWQAAGREGMREYLTNAEEKADAELAKMTDAERARAVYCGCPQENRDAAWSDILLAESRKPEEDREREWKFLFEKYKDKTDKYPVVCPTSVNEIALCLRKGLPVLFLSSARWKPIKIRDVDGKGSTRTEFGTTQYNTDEAHVVCLRDYYTLPVVKDGKEYPVEYCNLINSHGEPPLPLKLIWLDLIQKDNKFSCFVILPQTYDPSK
jgi:hypothetical protein